MPTRFSLRLILAASACCLSLPATAQVFVEGFVGRGFPESRRARISAEEARIDGVLVPARLRVDVDRLRATDTNTYGARIGYWRGALGIAFDAATLDPDVKRQTVRATANLRLDEELFGQRITIDPGTNVDVAIPRVTVPTTAALSVLGMVRLPRGRVQPYAFAGPAYLVTDTDISGDWGLRAGAGARLALTRRLGLFAEYRYTHVNAEATAGRFAGTVEDTGLSSGDIDVAIRLRNHAVAGGVSFQF